MTPIVPCEPAMLRRDAPYRHLTSTSADGTLLARASVWTAGYVTGAQDVGFIGHYAAMDDQAGRDLLHRACESLRQSGCRMAVGPIDGSTWRSYRFVTERGDEPPFFLEPHHPASWPATFARAGFETLSTYVSALATDLERLEPDTIHAEACLSRSAVRIRHLDMAFLDRELARIHTMCLESFRDNFLYAPLPLAEFRDLYLRLWPCTHPELILVAECEREPVGFVFALPDQTSAESRGATLIVKTLAVVPHMRGRGLGNVLVTEVQRRAAALGFSRAIHALMHEANPSTRISRRHARVFRRYALFARALR